MSLKQQVDFYRQFFRASFELELQYHSDYAFLQSGRDSDPLSRDVCIFMGVLCYELGREGYNLLEQLSFHTLEFEQVEPLFELSSFREVLEATTNNWKKDKKNPAQARCPIPEFKGGKVSFVAYLFHSS